jgi:hypothetical protein
MAIASAQIITKATNSHLYKYSAFTGERREWLKDIILNHPLYVPTLPQLRDPSDGRPKLSPLSEDAMFQFLYSSDIGTLGRNPQMSLPEQIWHGMVLDFNLKKYGVDWCMRECTHLLHKEFEDFRVYSLTKRFNNLSLWENYAANHSGYCLEFASIGDFFTCAYEVTYGQLVAFDLLNRDHRSGYWFFCKKVDYQSEEEIRILVPRRSTGVIPIDPNCLTRLILGKDMPEDDRNVIREWASHRTPQLKIVSASWDTYEQDIHIQG